MAPSYIVDMFENDESVRLSWIKHYIKLTLKMLKRVML